MNANPMQRLFLKLVTTTVMLVLALTNVQAKTPDPPEEVRGASPINKPPNTVFAEVVDGDTIPVGVLGNVYAFPKEAFSSMEDEAKWLRFVQDVKFVYPYAKIVYATLYETMEYLETINDPKQKERHLRQMEKDLVKEYEPVLRKMSYAQGKILLKLINRECKSSSYDLIKAYRGGFAASLWQGVARLFRADLKAGYDPEDEDYNLERIVIKIEQGQL